MEAGEQRGKCGLIGLSPAGGQGDENCDDGVRVWRLDTENRGIL